MLKENTLFGVRDKVAEAIQRLRSFEPEEGYYVAYMRAFERMVERIKARGKTSEWQNAQDVWNWWINLHITRPTKKNKGGEI